MSVPRALSNEADWSGDSMRFTCEVGRVLTGSETRRLIAELDDALDAGKRQVNDAIAAAGKGDASILPLILREKKLLEAAVTFGEELVAASAELAVAEDAVNTALRRGDDPTEAEQRQRDLAARVEQLRKRVQVNREARSDIDAAKKDRANQRAREVRAEFRKAAEAELARLNSEIADALFSRLERMTELRGQIGECDPHR